MTGREKTKNAQAMATTCMTAEAAAIVIIMVIDTSTYSINKCSNDSNKASGIPKLNPKLNPKPKTSGSFRSDRGEKAGLRLARCQVPSVPGFSFGLLGSE